MKVFCWAHPCGWGSWCFFIATSKSVMKPAGDPKQGQWLLLKRQLLLLENRDHRPPQTPRRPPRPQNRGFSIFYGGFRGQEPSHDVPRPSAMNFALRNPQNGAMSSGSDHFSSILDKIGIPKFRTLFEKVDPIQPLSPNRHVENDRILTL